MHKKTAPSASSPNRRPVCLQSWIRPGFAWTAVPDAFCIDVILSDPDIVEFIAMGSRKVTVCGTKGTSQALARLLGAETLHGQLQEAVWAPDKLKPTGARIKNGAEIIAHCHGVFLLPERNNLCVVVGRSKPLNPSAWIPAGLKAEADALLLEHRSKVAEFDEAIARRKKADEDLYAINCGLKKPMEFVNDRLAMESPQKRPVLTAERLLPSLPRAAKFPQPTSGAPERINRAAIAAIAASGWHPSRDGNYTGILPCAPNRRKQGLVSWVPHTGLPSYPEVRWAVQRRLPAALLKPRSEQTGRPQFDTGLLAPEGAAEVLGIDPESNDLEDALGELHLDDSDYRKRVDDIRKDAKGEGFDALAWFQSYHVWSEETWGIYVDARKLDDLALSFVDDFKSAGIRGSHSLAAQLAFGLIYAHELFHARVEAALSWMEISALKPRHLRYVERVYRALSQTPEWLEEALANWSAWNWFKAPGTQSMVARMSSNAEGVNRVVEASLDLAPPGYRDWRLGHDSGTWRTFANQLCTGNAKITTTGGLPLESVMNGPLPYDFQPADIPLRFVGPGIIADRLRSHPATFHVPSRREIERALRYFHHSLDASGGKGSHQKWTGQDQRAFTLPTRDPVRLGIFKSFLDHIGINKTAYVREVRPNL
jgi:hypothetical protein